MFGFLCKTCEKCDKFTITEKVISYAEHEFKKIPKEINQFPYCLHYRKNLKDLIPCEHFSYPMEL